MNKYLILSIVLVALIFGNVGFEFLGKVFVYIGNALSMFAKLPIFPNIIGIFGG